jgi:alpha-D-xyloside xylohydrolase
MLRALFVEYPEDPGSWLIDDEYLFGSDILAAPLLHENATGREVYLPPGNWIDYQSGESWSGGWHHIEAGRIPSVILVRDGAVIPRINLAQSTLQMDWSRLELAVFAKEQPVARGHVCLPSDNELHDLSLAREGGTFKLDADPLAGKVEWKIHAPFDH